MVTPSVGRDIVTAMNEDTRGVVTELLGRIGAGDPDHIADLFAEPVDWGLSWPSDGHPSAPWIRPRASRADVADHFRTIAAHHDPQRNATSVRQVLVDGQDAVVLGEIVQAVRASGTAYSSPFALHLTVQGGLVTRFHVYEDSLTVVRALTAGTP